jgi:hypothetical protein
MNQDDEVFNPSDKKQLRDFINEIITERFSQHTKNQERTSVSA